MFGQPKNNPKNLRIVKTARTEDAINEGAREGYRPLVKPVRPSQKIHNQIAVYQHRHTGEVKVSGDSRVAPGGEYVCVVPNRNYYPYQFPAPFAAYLLPADLIEGERVWLEDIIEDIVAVYGNQGWCPRLEACEAIWSMGDLLIQFDPEKDAPKMIG
jgi:hypothetical protein